MSDKNWWYRPLGDLEREISRLQGIVKHRDRYVQSTWDRARRRLPLLKAIYAGRKGQAPLFSEKEK